MLFCLTMRSAQEHSVRFVFFPALLSFLARMGSNTPPEERGARSPPYGYGLVSAECGSLRAYHGRGIQGAEGNV
jgi:hypothetical protein